MCVASSQGEQCAEAEQQYQGGEACAVGGGDAGCHGELYGLGPGGVGGGPDFAAVGAGLSFDNIAEEEDAGVGVAYGGVGFGPGFCFGLEVPLVVDAALSAGDHGGEIVATALGDFDGVGTGYSNGQWTYGVGAGFDFVAVVYAVAVAVGIVRIGAGFDFFVVGQAVAVAVVAVFHGFDGHAADNGIGIVAVADFDFEEIIAVVVCVGAVGEGFWGCACSGNGGRTMRGRDKQGPSECIVVAVCGTEGGCGPWCGVAVFRHGDLERACLINHRCVFYGFDGHFDGDAVGIPGGVEHLDVETVCAVVVGVGGVGADLQGAVRTGDHGCAVGGGGAQTPDRCISDAVGEAEGGCGPRCRGAVFAHGYAQGAVALIDAGGCSGIFVGPHVDAAALRAGNVYNIGSRGIGCGSCVDAGGTGLQPQVPAVAVIRPIHEKGRFADVAGSAVSALDAGIRNRGCGRIIVNFTARIFPQDAVCQCRRGRGVVGHCAAGIIR